MKKLFQRRKTDASERWNSFLERDTYWDEVDEWDSAEEEEAPEEVYEGEEEDDDLADEASGVHYESLEEGEDGEEGYAVDEGFESGEEDGSVETDSADSVSDAPLEEPQEYYADGAEEEEPQEYYADGAEEEPQEYDAEEEEPREYYADGAEEEEPQEYDAEEEEPQEYYEDGADEEEPQEYYADEPDHDGDAWFEDPGSFYGTGNRRVSHSGKRTREAGTERRRKKGFFAGFGAAISGMDAMDKVMVVAGVTVLALAIVTGGVFIHRNTTERQISGFSEVGRQLEGIGMIGEKGLLAVAGVQAERLSEATPEPGQETEPPQGYDETGYARDFSVEPNFTSIQKDLKIKFINRKTDKLVANVPFSVTVTDPGGKDYIWSDDDMDGIIHKKDIAPGIYQVAMEPLTDEKYASYAVFTELQSVEVKKEIVYEKVNVANEVKQESEVNVATEDTRKNETVVESTLKDTVAWVESKVISATYHEVAKNTIPDPVTLVASRWYQGLGLSGILRLTMEGGVLPPDAATEIPGDSTVTQAPDAPTPTPTPEAPTPTPEAPTPTPEMPPTPTPETPPLTPTPVPEMPSMTPAPVPGTPLPKGTVTVTPVTLSAVPGTALAAKATAAGFAGGQKIVYAVHSSNEAVVTATVNANGDIDISARTAGTATLTVTANYENGTEGTRASANIGITVAGSVTLTLDKTELVAYATVPAAIHAKVADGAIAAPVLTAESSDTGIATVSVDRTAILITGVAEGTAAITVKYAGMGQELSAVCSVTVKKHPGEDQVTLLKNADGQQLYVLAGNDYREAVWADYYTAEKFFIKGEARYSGWQTLEGGVYYFNADGSKVTGEQVIQGAKYQFASDGSLVTGANGSMGIDVSKWNGKIDWNAVKNSGVSYVIIRCGYRGSAHGNLIADPKFEENIQGATAAGLKVGVYFFSQAVDETEAVEEASMVLDKIRNYRISYPVFLDVEPSGGRADQIDRATRTAVCKAFCQTIQNGGYTAGIYANKTWLESKIDTGSLSAYKIWLAQYAASPTYRGRYDLWQYRATGNISGISGDVDFNISYLGY